MTTKKHSSLPVCDLNLDSLPWLPPDIRQSLAAIVAILWDAFLTDIVSIGLYGSWQRSTAGPESDVDLVVFLAHDVPWFDAQRGTINRPAAHEDRLRWHRLEKKANRARLDNRTYSISMVTPAMLTHYAARGPIHLQNWVRALEECHLLWRG